MNKHPDFISLEDVCRDLIVQMDYSTPDNFTGGVVPGYKAKKAFLAKEPAMALAKVQEKTLAQGYSLKIFDAFRPVKAVQYFQDWAKLPETNPDFKKRFYPNFNRLELFEQGFIAKQSSHSRGCATDLTLVDLKTGKELDMGSEFDYFHELSHTDSPLINDIQRTNRVLLKELMESEGFRNFYQEWWHFSFRPEPFPGVYFDFDVE
jgi:D-alanyl-D-alanine dipeptidase